MKRTLFRLSFALLFLGALFLSPVRTPASDDAPGTRADKELLAKVSKRLLDACDRDPVPGWAWPPDIQFQDKNQINAYASLKTDENPPQPIVRIDVLLMKKVVQGDPDRLALILGHELSHILLRHVGKSVGNTPFVQDAFTRDQEFAADLSGVELMRKAGFSFHKGKKAFERMKDPDLKLDYSSFEALGTNHPSWDERLAHIDKENSTAWKSMSAFDNGVFFLATEQYPLAEQCFDRVTKEFPGCYEAWTNLGFACLMEYCDKLDTRDLRDYGIGQVLVGGFYRRAASIAVRGRDVKMWMKAVGALNTALHLKEALGLKDNLTVIKADLGLAHLVNPDGKDVGEATQFLSEAAADAASDKTLDPADHAALLVNLGVTDLAAEKLDKALVHLQEGEKIGLAGDAPRRRDNPALAAALLYNHALLLAAGKDMESKEKALKLFEEYLDTVSPFSFWRPIAYEHYVSLCKTLGRPTKDEEVFAKGRPEQFRLVSAVKLKSDKEVTLGEDAKEVIKKLGAGREVVAAGETNLKSVVYDKEGVRLLLTDKVVAICLDNADAPALPLRLRGSGPDEAATLRVGMSAKELQAALPREPETVSLTDPEMPFRYYRDLGLAVRIVKGRVVALVVAQIP